MKALQEQRFFIFQFNISKHFSYDFLKLDEIHHG